MFMLPGAYAQMIRRAMVESVEDIVVVLTPQGQSAVGKLAVGGLAFGRTANRRIVWEYDNRTQV